MASPSGKPAKAQTSVGVVDDDAIARSWVRLSLCHTEFRFAGEASTMLEAMVLIQRRRPELLVVDYRLPDGRGTDLIRSLRRMRIATPVLVITAAPQVGLNEEVREAGGQGVVLKRADTAGLLADLRKVRPAAPSSTTNTRAARAVIAGFAAFAAEMSLVAIAEGIEDNAVVGILVEQGLHIDQGYYIGLPGPLATR